MKKVKTVGVGFGFCSFALGQYDALFFMEKKKKKL